MSRAVLLVTPALLVDLFKADGIARHDRVIDGLPSDARVVREFYDWRSRSFAVVIESSSLTVPAGAPEHEDIGYPIVTPRCERIDPGGTS